MKNSKEEFLMKEHEKGRPATDVLYLSYIDIMLAKSPDPEKELEDFLNSEPE